MEKKKTTKWRCEVCGYIHEGTQPPDICPVCGAGKEDFSKHQAPASDPLDSKDRPSNWVCGVCGYTHEGFEAPETCPVCSVPKDQFQAVREKKIKPNSDETLSESKNAKKNLNIVIAGAGIAGLYAAETIRSLSKEAHITLINGEKDLPYNRLNLTRYLAGEIKPEELTIYPEAWYKENKIDLINGSRVSLINPKKKSIKLESGQKFDYDKCIYAAGAHAFIPSIEGTGLKNVFTLRTKEDADHILNSVNQSLKSHSKPSVAVIGGGILGLETAAAISKQGAEVSVLEAHKFLMPRQLHQEAASKMHDELIKTGIKIHYEARTKKITNQNENAHEIELENGNTISASVIIVAAGVRSNTNLLKSAGIETDKAAIVDHDLCSSVPDLYAAGDACEFNGVFYGIWPVAKYTGKIAARNALGMKSSFGGMERSNILKVVGVDLFSIGNINAADGSCQIFSGEKKGAYYSFTVYDHKITGAVFIGDLSLSARVKTFIKEQKDLHEYLNGNISFDKIYDLISS